MTTVGEALIHHLEACGVDTVFGIPGVHTVELYRGLARSGIRHVTPRHEQGAAFMADGYARVSGKPGVAFLITGPGLTNAITAIAQARADSVPMLVVSGVNRRVTLGKGFGYLHELADQRGLMAEVAVSSERVEEPAALGPALARAFACFSGRRPGPVHIEIPLDVMALPAAEGGGPPSPATAGAPDAGALRQAASLIDSAARPLILAGGGARNAERALTDLAEKLDAPVVATTNARGLMHAHPLLVPASPSLRAVRALLGACDLAIAVGTEFGPTDYDMYDDGGLTLPGTLVRIDVDAAQLARHPATVAVQADAASALATLATLVSARPASDGRGCAGRARDAALAEIGPEMAAQLRVVEAIRDTLPDAIIVGDSTQPVYAANLYYDHDRPGGWFNAATGFGALGFGPPAAIGAALAAPEAAVVCLCGDGGFQFTLPELATAVDVGARLAFVIWNNRGYREIEASMRAAGIEPVGVSPAPPRFQCIAAAYGLPFSRVEDDAGLARALESWRRDGPTLIEYAVD